MKMKKLTEQQYNFLMSIINNADLDYIICGNRLTEYSRMIEMYKKYKNKKGMK